MAAFLNSQKLDWKVFKVSTGPFIFHMVMVISYIIFGIPMSYRSNGAIKWTAFGGWWLGILISFLPVWYFKIKEYRYVSEYSSLDFKYNKSFNQIFQFLCLVALLVLQVLGYEGNLIPLIGSVICFSMIGSLIIQLNVSYDLAMFSQIIWISIYDTRYFFVLAIAILFAFALGILVLEAIVKAMKEAAADGSVEDYDYQGDVPALLTHTFQTQMALMSEFTVSPPSTDGYPVMLMYLQQLYFFAAFFTFQFLLINTLIAVIN